MRKNSTTFVATLLGLSSLVLLGCNSLKTPTTAEVAVSAAAVDSAASAGAVQYAPGEMAAARDKLARAKAAMADKDYKTASDWAAQAQVDAKLAQSKADSSKAQAAAFALQDDIRILREELERSGK